MKLYKVKWKHLEKVMSEKDYTDFNQMFVFYELACKRENVECIQFEVLDLGQEIKESEYQDLSSWVVEGQVMQ